MSQELFYVVMALGGCLLPIGMWIGWARLDKSHYYDGDGLAIGASIATVFAVFVLGAALVNYGLTLPSQKSISNALPIRGDDK